MLRPYAKLYYSVSVPQEFILHTIPTLTLSHTLTERKPKTSHVPVARIRQTRMRARVETCRQLFDSRKLFCHRVCPLLLLVVSRLSLVLFIRLVVLVVVLLLLLLLLLRIVILAIALVVVVLTI